MMVFTQLLRAVYYPIVIFIVSVSLIAGLFFWRVGELSYGAICLITGVILAFVYFNPKAYNYRFIAPALLTLSLVIILPLLHIIGLSLTNLSEANKLTYRKALAMVTEQTFVADDGIQLRVNGWAEGNQLNLFFNNTDTDEWFFASTPVAVSSDQPTELSLEPAQTAPEEKFDRKFAITYRNQLDTITLFLPNGATLSKDKLRSFAERQPRFEITDKQTLLDRSNGDIIFANNKTGQFEIIESSDEDRIGNFISPTFLKDANFSNYADFFLDRQQLGVFLVVFFWSVAAALITVTLSYLIALVTASLVSWSALKEREFYKFTLVACYALPAFAVFNTFFWLFATTQAPWGDVLLGGPFYNIALDWFGLDINWQFDPVFSRIKMLIIQFWFFFPFMFMLCLGVIQSIPTSIYEAAKLEGAGVRQSFLRITLPMTFAPLAPVLIIVFATAFNDLGLVDQITYGFAVPEIQGSAPLASHIDLLVSYANRVAFGSALSRGVGFGFYSTAATLFTVIFVVLALLSFLYLRLIKRSRLSEAV